MRNEPLNPHPESTMQRRDFLALSALGGGAVFASGLAGCASGTRAANVANADFYFVQLSDTHWGYQGPANPDAAVTLRKAVATVNALSTPPEFVVFTGDLTHTTDDPVERRRRLAEFKSIVADLKVSTVRFMPGEHDAALDRGAAYKEFFGETFYTFDHKGVHFIAVDNVSDPGAKIGDEQLAWLRAELAKLDKQAPIVVLTHRPLFDLAPKWDWATRDGAQAIELLMPYSNVTVFYGHIHQEHHQMTGHIAHHSAKSLIFALPAPGSQPNRTPLPWDAGAPYKGLGFREVEAQDAGGTLKVTEFPAVRA
jgi:3',5'-cyclic AMP phosphodiesterase CpdA